jgi:hypothetical protein
MSALTPEKIQEIIEILIKMKGQELGDNPQQPGSNSASLSINYTPPASIGGGAAEMAWSISYSTAA